MAVAAALAVVFLRRALHGALSLIVCFASIAGLFLQLEAQFLGAVQIIVYAGAIMVLFLFVIMLLEPKGEKLLARKKGFLILAIPLSLYVGSILLTALTAQAKAESAEGLSEAGRIAPIAAGLFRDYLLPFEATSVLILVAVIGAIMLAKKKS